MAADHSPAEEKAIAELRRRYLAADYELQTARTDGGYLNVTLWHKRHESIPDAEFHIDASGRPKAGHASL